MKRTLIVTLALACLALRAEAEVLRVAVSTRTDVGNSGYEKIVGTIYFAISPADPRNVAIVDLDKARLNADRRVEFSADFYILKPKDAARSNGVALVEVANRGNKGLLSFFARATSGGLDPSSDADLGDGFLTRQGYTMVWVGWQFDADRTGGRVKLDAPIAPGLSGGVRARFTPDQRTNDMTLADLAGYSLDPSGQDASLTVRDGAYGHATRIARAEWSLHGHTLTLKGGFEPGRTYEIAVRATDLPIAGTGLAAFRDTASWLKYRPDALASVRYAYAFGLSQSGRFLRTFLYYGFNSDERNRPVFDGIFAHIAGGARLSINERGAVPNGGKAPSPAFPFADAAIRDPISGRVDGLLDNERARVHQPKVFYTNSAVEYWSGDRLAALVHTSPDGKADITPPQNVRAYFLAGTQHVPARFPSTTTRGQQPDNPLEYAWTLRALLTAMDGWVRQGTPPPTSQYPKLADNTLVSPSVLSFPDIPGVQSPRMVSGGREGDTPLPFLVPAVDADGNERSGVRTAEHAVPVGTFTGWNFRNHTLGATNQLVGLIGSAIPFSRTAAEKRAGDMRPSIAERYGSKERYLTLASEHCAKLVEGGYLLASDVAQVMKRVADQWELVSRDR